MQIITVREKLHQMHQKYLDDANTKPCAKLSEEDAEKILTIKKKLASLEKERCVRLRDRKDVTAIDQKIAKQKEHCIRLRDRKDVTAIDQKIAKQKERFTVYCRQKQR